VNICEIRGYLFKARSFDYATLRMTELTYMCGVAKLVFAEEATESFAN